MHLVRGSVMGDGARLAVGAPVGLEGVSWGSTRRQPDPSQIKKENKRPPRKCGHKFGGTVLCEIWLIVRFFLHRKSNCCDDASE